MRGFSRSYHQMPFDHLLKRQAYEALEARMGQAWGKALQYGESSIIAAGKALWRGGFRDWGLIPRQLSEEMLEEVKFQSVEKTLHAAVSG